MTPDEMRLALWDKKKDRKVPKMSFGGLAKRALRGLKGTNVAEGKKTSIIKDTGGNWLSGSVESHLGDLKAYDRGEPISNADVAKLKADIERMRSGSVQNQGVQENLRSLQSVLDATEKNAALNNWVDKSLTKYVKNQMGTAEDPVRKLAEQDIVHTRPEHYADRAEHRRLLEGRPQLGQSDKAKAWENLADHMIDPSTVAAQAQINGLFRPRSPSLPSHPDAWMAKAAPDTKVYGLSDTASARNLGFEHIMDVLREDLTTGRILPENLNKINMEHAVRRTHEYDQELAKRMREASTLAREGLPVLKEFPNGFRWLQLNKPGSFAAESDAMGHSARGYEPPKGHADWVAGSGNAGTSSYGLGGWEAIKSGKAKMYSLVDKEGKSHATIEVKQSSKISPEQREEKISNLVKGLVDEGNSEESAIKQATTLYPESESYSSINQIKPPGNYWTSDASMGRIAENPKYMEDIQPYLQDFVKTGKWSSVNDLKNTGLIHRDGKYLTEAEHAELLANQLKPEGMANGGLVHMAPGGVVKWASQLAKTINSHKMESMSGEQWMKWLNANAPKSAKKEALASGTLDWLPQQGKVSKSAIIEHMKANAPQIKTTKFSNNPNPELQDRYDDLHDRAWTSKLTSSERTEMEELEQKLENTPKTKFDEYVLPGGKNYREMTLSSSNPTGDDYIVPGAHSYGDNAADLNRILHMRMNDRPYTGGNALNLEELQSDWAQRGRSEGFKKPPTIISEEIANRHNTLTSKLRNNEATPEELSELADIRLQLHPKINRGLPSGPYVQNTEDWTRLGLHNAIKEAAEQGHNAVTWTGGEAQAKRYDLSRHLDRIDHNLNADGTYNLSAIKNGSEIFSQENIPASQLADHVGKDAADKIIKGEGVAPTKVDKWEAIDSEDYPNLKSLTGLDLQVGGEGMKGYYDNIVPSVSNDILKKMGVAERVGEFDVGTGVPHQGFNITPEMLDYIVSNGLPRFKSGGAVKMGVGGKVVKELVKAAAPKLATKAPEIVIPSEISQLKAYILQQQGKQGAKRVERAADEVPNLESMYQQQALRKAFNDDASAVMVIKPEDFKKYAAPFKEVTHRIPADYPAGISKDTVNTDDWVKHLQSLKTFQDVPYLQLDKGEQGLPIVPHIAGHEGRHRSRALANRGEQSSLVRMVPRAELRDGFPMSSQEEYLDALQKEMEMTDNMVTPQTYTIPRDNDKSIFEQERRIIRPNIRLPEMFAKGGAVHMKDGGTPFNDNPHEGMSHGTARPATMEEMRALQPWKYEEEGLEEPLISPDMAIGTGLPTAIAKLLGKGVMGAGKALAPVGNQFLEDYMARQGMTLNAAPTKRGVVSSLNDNANTANPAKYKPAGVMNSAEKPEPMLASKAYNEIMGETVSPTSVADRMIVRPGTSKEKGGSMFPWLSTVDPNYEGTVWANKGAGAASRMINTAKENEGVIFTPQIGSPEMHRSNQVVYEKILRAFDRAKAEGKLTPELMRAYNDRLKSFYENDKGGQLFQPNFDIGATNLRKEATTFPHRAAIAEVLGGKGLRAYGYKNREAAQIVPYNKILQSTTEPQSLGAATGSLGPRFFTLNGEREVRPDLHSAFPEMVGGTDLGIQYPHTPREHVFTDFIKKIEASKGRPIGHMDWDKNRVLQKVRPEMVYRLEDMGLKSGGAVKMSEGGSTHTGGKFSHEALLAKTKADEPIHEQVQRYLDMMKVDAAGGRDVYGTSLYGRAKMDIPVGKATVSPYLEGSAYRPAGQTFGGQLTGAGVNVTLPFKQGGDVGVSRDTMMIELMNKGKR